MSDSDSGSGAGRREVAYRLFAAEFDDANFSYSESDEERAPNYVITPTGGRVNRLFLVGVLTELERVNEDMLRARIVDPTGPFVVYAGQYQPDALSFLERAEPPAFLAVTGKARTFQPEDSDAVYTSVRPESISEVDAETRDRWVVQAAEQTIDRVATMAAAKGTGLAGEALREGLESECVDDGLAHGVALALEHYGTTGEYLAAVREMALDAARVVAGEREEVGRFDVAPGEGGEADLDALAADLGAAAEPDEEPAVAAPAGGGSADSQEATQPAEGAAETGEPAVDEPATEPTGAESEPATATGDDETAAAEAGAGGSDAVGDFEADVDDEEIGDFEPGEFDLDEEEREELEEQYGTEFETGNEVDEPGAAGIEPEEPEPATEPEASEEEETAGAAPDAEPAAETETAPEPESEPEPDVEGDTAEAGGAEPELEEPDVEAVEPEEPAHDAESEAGAEAEETPADVDVDEAVMETMDELAGGEGADREELVATVAEEYGFDPGEVEDAIEDALMSGQCYEPDEGKLKPI